MIPLTAFFSWLVTFRKRKYAFDQMVFATEMNCFYLIWGFLLLPLLLYAFQWLFQLISNSRLPIGDDISGILIGVPMVIFVALASRRFYELNRWQAILFALYFFVVHTFIVHYLYKFVLFATVIKQIH